MSLRRIAAGWLVCAACLHTTALRAAGPETDEHAMKRFIEALAILDRNAADEVNLDQAFYGGAMPGMLRHLDPHSVFFDPGQFEQLRQMQTSTSKGFGSVVSVLPGRVVVLQTLPNTPSAKAGMSPGDEILAVNGYRLDRFDPEQIVELLTESKQKPAQLVVRRPGNVRLQELTLVPETMQTSSVERVFALQPGIGYIRVSAFEENTARQIHDGIEKLGGRELKGLVIDLRNNPGGLVTAALETASLFLNAKQVILSARGRNVPETTERVPEGNSPYAFPLAIIVNEKTASASEIVSGALQDHDRATIVGEPSFGKGLVQKVYPLSEETGLALTTALYYTPSGRSIQKPFREDNFALGATAAHPNEQTEFHTDSGRKVTGGGGIVPDIAARRTSTPLRDVLEGSGAFVEFATEYVRDHKISEGWEVPAAALDAFQTWLSERQIQPSLHEWISHHEVIARRLKTEVYNLTLGVAKGDEVEAQGDPQIQAALQAVLDAKK